jgi:hypothetical protein
MPASKLSPASASTGIDSHLDLAGLGRPSTPLEDRDAVSDLDRRRCRKHECIFYHLAARPAVLGLDIGRPAPLWACPLTGDIPGALVLERALRAYAAGDPVRSRGYAGRARAESRLGLLLGGGPAIAGGRRDRQWAFKPSRQFYDCCFGACFTKRGLPSKGAERTRAASRARRFRNANSSLDGGV